MERQPTKEEKEWNKQLSSHLERYGLIRQWSDLANWLSKLKQILSELKPGIVILERDALFKRLASCLNITLPIALQEQTLECYDLIMNSQLTVQSLPLLCVGLFPFFQSATVRVKQKTLDLFKQHLVKIGTELNPLISGLISAILPGLLQMNELLQKNIMGLLDFYGELLGPEIVIASIWSAMLRASHCRIAGLKYLASKLISQGKGIEENDLNDSQDQDANESNVDSIVQGRREMKEQVDSKIDYMPYKNTLVVNTLISCLQDPNSLVIKSALDFLYKYVSLRNEQFILRDEQKSKLIDSVILLLMKRDVSTTRKINIWLFGKPDEDNKYNITSKNESVVPLIIQSLLRHFKDQTKEESLAPLKIILNIYSEHQHLIQRTLPALSQPLLQFMFKVYKKEESNKESIMEGMKISQRVMNHTGSQKMIILISLGNKILQNVNPINEKEWLRHLELVEFFQEKLLKEEEAKENKELMFRILVMLIVTFQNVINNKRCLLAGLNLAMNVIKKLISQPRAPEDVRSFETSVTAFEDYYKALSTLIKTQPHYQKHHQISILLMIQIYKLVGNKDNHDWIELLCESIMHEGYFLSSTEGIVKILELGSSDVVYKPLRQKIMELSAVKNSYLQEAISILYQLLSNPNSQSKSITLLLKLSKEFPKLLSDVISTSFSRYSQSHQEIAITKFAIFWRLSGRYKELVSWRELNEMNKLGLFLILDYLDHQNPLVKHTTKQWITESLVDFHRVLDPLLEVLVQPHSTFYKTFQGQLVYCKDFSMNRCVDILKKIKQILLQVTDNTMSFIMKPISEGAKTVYDRFSNTNNQGNYPTYLEFIFKVMVRYLQGKFVLANGPCSLSLVACELLQIIITTIDDPKTCYLLLKPFMKQILECLHFSILNSQNVSQVQLVNLLKSILFNSSLRKAGNDGDIKTFLKQLMGSKLLIQSLVRGLDNESIYIKQKYVQFIILSIPLFLEYHPNATSLICHILNVLTSKIVVINARSEGNNSYLKEEILVILEGVKSLMTYFLDLKIKPFEKEKTQNDTDNGLFSLNSWKSFVSLGLNVTPPTKVKRNQQIVKQILNDLYQTILTITQCWNISELKDMYKVTRTGIENYQSEKFLTFNKQLYSMIGQMETNDSLENYLIRLIRVIFNNYPHQTLNCFAVNWCSNSSQNSRLKILEILIFIGLPVELFYEVIVETQIVDRLAKADKKRTSKTPMTIERGTETSILLMCQAFTHYAYQSFNIFQSQHTLTLWNAFFKFLKMFMNSTNVLVVYQVLELFHLFIQKFNPKELLKDQKFKRQLQTIFNEILILVQVATGRSKFTIGEKFGFRFQELLPLPTSLYEIYKKEISKVDEIKMACLCFNQTQGDEKGWEYTRLHCFMVLRKLAYDILLNLFTESEIILAKKLRQLLTLIFPVVEDKSLENMLFAEKSSEIICYIMEQKQVFLREFRNDLLQIFNKDDFFICTRKTLQQWAKIVDLVIDNNKEMDIFIDYLSRVPSASSFFSKETTETKKKIKSFERICFILYSGSKDKYIGKLEALLQKIVDVIKGTETSQPVLILILFCIRIVILRTSNDALTKLLADLWPRILFVLMGIFQKEPDNKPGTINLVWAALKLIQLVSITEMSSFNTHQWIFFHDFVNIQLAGSSDQISLKGEPNDYGHRPLAQKWLPKDIRAFFTDSTPVATEKSRGIIIKEDKIDDIELLKAKSLALSQYMIINSSSKSKIDIKQLEEIIQGDFLSLDEFIYKVT